MKNNMMISLLAGSLLLSTHLEAQNTKDEAAALFMIAHADLLDVAPFTHENKNIVKDPAEPLAVDYPTASYPEVVNMKAEKEKAFQHISWQINDREDLVYTEIQSSNNNVNFTTVGVIVNDQNRQSATYDYFIPLEKNTATSYRLVQYDLSNRKYISTVFY